MATESDVLTPKQVALIAALLVEGDMTRAAQTAGVARATGYKWLRSPAFRAALRQAEGEALRGLARRLAGLGDAAADTLKDALDPAQPMNTRLRAADLVTGRLPGLLEVADLQQRIEDLERRIANHHAEIDEDD